MNPDEMAVKLAETDQRARSNTRRLEKVEAQTDALTRIATSVEVMATKQDYIAQKVDGLDGKVSALEAEPGKRWRYVVEKAIYIVVAAVLGFILAKAGLA